jgi:cyclohexyl-isocyanide hydratase
MSQTQIGFLIFPGLLQLDFTGAYGVLAAGPDSAISLIWKDTQAVISDDGLAFTPNTTILACPPLDVVVVPGGAGVLPLVEDAERLEFLQRQARTARYVCSVCTGALVLGAAGLLQGYAATTHWLSWNLLEILGASPQHERVVVDRNRITAAGVTSGIDMALRLAGILWGDDVAQGIQLNMEYAPEPPYQAGDPNTAPQSVVSAMLEKTAARQAERLAVVTRAAEKLTNQ